MKKLIAILILISTISNAEVINISGEYNVLTLTSGNTYNVVGDSKINNLNWNGVNVKFNVLEGINVEFSHLNINNGGTFINNGNVKVVGNLNVNSSSLFRSNTFLTTGGFHNNTGHTVYMCGVFKSESIHLNTGGIISDCCLFVSTEKLHVNVSNGFSGTIHVFVSKSMVVNQLFSNTTSVTYKYDGKLNHPELMGAASYINSTTSLCTPLPVKISQLEVKNNSLLFKFTEVVNVQKIEIERSNNGKDWKTFQQLNNIETNKLYKINLSEK